MDHSLQASSTNPPLAALITACYVKKSGKITIEWTEKSSVLKIDGKVIFSNSLAICQYLVRVMAPELGSQDLLAKTELNHWCNFSDVSLNVNGNALKEGLNTLNKALASKTYLVENKITLADVNVFAALYANKSWLEVKQSVEYENISRWFNFISDQDFVGNAINMLPADFHNKLTSQTEKPASSGNKEEGKFIELEGAKMGEVVVRFPPEASGYLHIGHAKAALLNQHYRNAFKGKLIMRFDDTNPAKEKADFEKVILEDLKLLDVHPDIFSHTSDHFETMLKFCEKLIKEGKAYVDDTEPEKMKNEREARVDSVNRNNSVEKNLQMWSEMVKGSDLGQKCCVRAKIDMKSDNGCMRDPAMYRCKVEPHVTTGTKYKVYPTYDFACPIVDSIEGVTHALRTTEYHDRDDQFFWFIDALGIRKPHIWEYSRLCMMHTVLSKRKLTWFVNENLVDGWDDPRFPTVRGVLRRGMTVEGLQQFIIAQGSSRSVVMMEWDKIWAFNKKVIDPTASRYTALEKEQLVPVFVSNVVESKTDAQLHPKDASLGKKEMWTGPKVLIEAVDADCLKEDTNATFINWGNLTIKKINKNSSGKIQSVEADPNLENKDYKKTTKLTWFADTSSAPLIPCVCVYFDYIVTKSVLGKDEDFKDFVNPVTKIEVLMEGEPALKNVKKSEIIQIQRKGFFICDEPYEEVNRHTGRTSPIVLFAVPDGSAKQGTPFDSDRFSKQEKKSKSSKSKDEQVKLAGGNDVNEIYQKISNQGDKIRNLKSSKAPKATIEEEVKVLLSLKGQYKELTGKDWKPGAAPVTDSKVSTPAATGNVDDVNEKIVNQGNKIRELKSSKAPKATVEEEVKLLLTLKSQYKDLTGKDWKPGQTPKANTLSATATRNAEDINEKILNQGNKIRELKSSKADKATIDKEVKVLLTLKSQYKEQTGKDWKPAATPKTDNKMEKSDSAKLVDDPEILKLKDEIEAQGLVVRELKSSGADKAKIDAEVQKLLALKSNYKTKTGVDLAPGGNSKKAKKDKKQNNEQKKDNMKQTNEQKKDHKTDDVQGLAKKVTRLGLEAKKEDNLPEWYSQTITKAEMIEYYDVSGCYTLRPWSYSIWEKVVAYFDKEIKDLGVQNCYFPMFVSQQALEKEKSHIADFSPEVAWVTKSGNSELAEPIAIRPTSETVMYPAYAKWIQSHRDLPLKLNQWCSVVRWEFKHPQPFLRTREFLWQEGHTAFQHKEEAVEEVYTMLDLYAKIYTDLLAIPVIKGKKTVKEKFAGGDFTTTVEIYIHASGRAIQGATSHHLGQNFSKMLEIQFEDPKTKQKQYVYQNSWGITTRSIGVMTMVHGDNTGLVLPPRIACYQVVIVPCGISASMAEEEKTKLLETCDTLHKKLKAVGVRVMCDTRDNYSPGWKFNHWELKGVPIRAEIGPRDMKQGQFVMVRRDTNEKSTASLDKAEVAVENLLENIHHSLYNKAYAIQSKHVVITKEWNEFCSLLEKKCLMQTPFCGDKGCEENIKKESAREESVDPGAPSMGAKSLCIPFEQPGEITEGMKCIHPKCTRAPQFYTLFGRSY